MSRLIPLSLVVATLLLLPAPGEAQGLGTILSGVRNGGGWVTIPIEDGRGRFSTAQLPVAAMSVAGCVNVWEGHSGTWEIRAFERILGSRLSLHAEPGIGVPFEHDFGMTAQVDFDFQWSEARDTTLYLWVGMSGRGEGGEDACHPS